MVPQTGHTTPSTRATTVSAAEPRTDRAFRFTRSSNAIRFSSVWQHLRTCYGRAPGCPSGQQTPLVSSGSDNGKAGFHGGAKVCLGDRFDRGIVVGPCSAEPDSGATGRRLDNNGRLGV